MTKDESMSDEREVAVSDRTVIQFPTPEQRATKGKDLGVISGGVWTCGCGGQDWVLYGNGICLCRGCNCISTIIRCVEEKLTGSN
jgi:hypothetical protein